MKLLRLQNDEKDIDYSFAGRDVAGSRVRGLRVSQLTHRMEFLLTRMYGMSFWALNCFRQAI